MNHAATHDTTAAEAVSPDAVLAAKRKAREDAITALATEGRERGSTCDRSFWAMVYDFERAPSTTNRRQLAQLGIVAPTAAEVDTLTDDEVADRLRGVVDGLARLGIYLLNTDHLDDRQLLGRLAADILDEEVREVIGTDVQEWIDLAMQADIESETAAKRSDRDASLPRPANWRRDASDRPEGEATDAIR